jgi:hypothetical protein
VADVATTELQLEKLKAIESFDRSMASTAVDAFADGRIDEATLGGFCSGTTISHRRRRNTSSSRTRAASAAGARSPQAKRRRPSRRAYCRSSTTGARWSATAATTRPSTCWSSCSARSSTRKRARSSTATSSTPSGPPSEAQRQAAALQKKAEHDAQLAAAARGRAADLEQAAIRGLIPIARVAEVWAADFDGETVEILTALLEDKRAAYVAQQAARDAAAGKAKQRGVDVGKLEDAVINGVISLGQYREQLTRLNFADEDANLLVATLDAKMRARADAQAAHEAAVAEGKVRHVDIATLEILVRRGYRTMADFDATLRALNFDDAARAALRDRLQIQIDDDARAAAARDAANAKLRDKGLSWDQERRAVLLGVRTLDEAATFLLDNGFNADARDVLLAELRADVQEAEDARQRRESAAARVDARDAPLADIARAARLGLIPVQTYLDRLARDKWTDDAIALETDLLLTEIADVQAARARRDELEAASHDRGLSLEQAARVVRAHLAPIAVYVSAAQAAGYSDEATALLARLLADEVAGDDAAAARRGTIAGELAGKALTLAQLEASVLAGVRTLQAFGDTVRGSATATRTPPCSRRCCSGDSRYRPRPSSGKGHSPRRTPRASCSARPLRRRCSAACAAWTITPRGSPRATTIRVTSHSSSPTCSSSSTRAGARRTMTPFVSRAHLGSDHHRGERAHGRDDARRDSRRLRRPARAVDRAGEPAAAAVG